MKNSRPIYENSLIYFVILLIGIGIIMLYSASSTLAFNQYNQYAFFLSRHVFRVLVSLAAFYIMYKIEFKYLKQYSHQIFVISAIIVIAAYFLSSEQSTRRWLIINGKNLFTTSDLAKFSLIIFTANFIENYKKDINNITILIKKYLPYVFLVLLLILFQPDLSTTLAISSIIISMLFVAGLKFKYLFFPIFISSIGIFYKILSTPYQFKRLSDWKNGIYNTQIEHSIQALGNGGFWGVGFGKSIIKDGFMPEVHTDFILPIIGEETGFFGILVIFILFLIIYFLGMKICKASPDIFSSMLALGITINILYYFLINASYVVGIFPTTGLPIPFISYGGSHTLFCLMSIGILLNISKHTNIYRYKNLL